MTGGGVGERKMLSMLREAEQKASSGLMETLCAGQPPGRTRAREYAAGGTKQRKAFVLRFNKSWKSAQGEGRKDPWDLEVGDIL